MKGDDYTDKVEDENQARLLATALAGDDAAVRGGEGWMMTIGGRVDAKRKRVCCFTLWFTYDVRR